MTLVKQWYINFCCCFFKYYTFKKNHVFKANSSIEIYSAYVLISNALICFKIYVFLLYVCVALIIILVKCTLKKKTHQKPCSLRIDKSMLLHTVTLSLSVTQRLGGPDVLSKLCCQKKKNSGQKTFSKSRTHFAHMKISIWYGQYIIWNLILLFFLLKKFHFCNLSAWNYM